ncbi:MAG: phosphate ABC transporter permease PstA [Lachnospiraceae bacterium]|nr:phosphate ABC transporter permease PstA [Lachnospiraceae bacterium]
MTSKIKDGLILGLIYLAAFFTAMLLTGIVVFVFIKGSGFLRWSFLTTVPSILKGTEGIAGNIVNTLYIVSLTLLIAIPVGVGAAVWLNEYADRSRFVRLVEFTTQTLAGIPSVIFGLFGMMFFGRTLGLGYSILTGSLTLTLMVLPLITRNAQEALKAVPDSYRFGAVSMGATKWYMIHTILLPCAMPGIVTGVLLAVGRIVGESAALLLTAGSGYSLPKTGDGIFHKIMESGGTLAVQLYLNMSKAQYDAAFGIAAVLICIVLVINFLTEVFAGKIDTVKK